MARIRTIKPDFFTSDTVSALPMRARLTWIGLWTHCDDHGRCRDNVRLVKAGVWPLDDVSLRDVESDIKELEHAGVLFRYAVDGKSYIQITNWSEHQKVDRPSKSPIPAPGELPPSPPETLARAREPASSPRDRKGKEGNGREGTRAPARDGPLPAEPPGPEPPSKCPKHLDDPEPPPCGQCADARRNHDRWELAEADRKRTQPKCPRHRGQPAHNCAGCRGDALAAPEETR